MMQINPFLTSVAAPVAAKTVQAVAHVAQEAGQSFLRTLSQLRETATEAPRAVAAETASATGQLQALASSFRQWLDREGVQSPFELQFSVASNGDPIANVVGSESAKIVDLLYGHDQWLEKLSQLTRQASAEAASSLPGTSLTGSARPVKLSISSDDAYVIRDPSLPF